MLLDGCKGQVGILYLSFSIRLVIRGPLMLFGPASNATAAALPAAGGFTRSRLVPIPGLALSASSVRRGTVCGGQAMPHRDTAVPEVRRRVEPSGRLGAWLGAGRQSAGWRAR